MLELQYRASRRLVAETGADSDKNPPTYSRARNPCRIPAARRDTEIPRRTHGHILEVGTHNRLPRLPDNLYPALVIGFFNVTLHTLIGVLEIIQHRNGSPQHVWLRLESNED